MSENRVAVWRWLIFFEHRRQDGQADMTFYTGKELLPVIQSDAFTVRDIRGCYHFFRWSALSHFIVEPTKKKAPK